MIFILNFVFIIFMYKFSIAKQSDCPRNVPSNTLVSLINQDTAQDNQKIEPEQCTIIASI